MSWMKPLRCWWWSEKLEEDLDEELRSHIEMRAEDLIKQGMTLDGGNPRA